VPAVPVLGRVSCQKGPAVVIGVDAILLAAASMFVINRPGA
jgi:hypothetical protein